MKKYKSLHSGIETSAAQYLAEVMCIRQAEKKREKLPPKFWNIPKWKMPYKQQILAAHSLLKIYEPEEIILAINRKDAKWIFSLRFPGLNQIILEEKEKLDKQKLSLSKVDNTMPINIPVGEPIKPFGTETKINKLRKLDD